MNKNTQRFKEEFESIISNAEKLFENISGDDFNKKPSTKIWSVGECISHLNSTAEKYIPAINSAILNAHADNLFSEEIFKPRFIAGKMISFLEPPYKIKLKTFEVFMPASKLSAFITFETFIKRHNTLIELVEESDGINLNKAVLTSPVSKRIRLKLGEAFMLITVHARRHLWQARQTINRIT